MAMIGRVHCIKNELAAIRPKILHSRSDLQAAEVHSASDGMQSVEICGDGSKRASRKTKYTNNLFLATFFAELI